ncbi:MAG: hypothetical protein V7K54_02940 [Nostoc sp.]
MEAGLIIGCLYFDISNQQLRMVIMQLFKCDSFSRARPEKGRLVWET